MWNLPGQVTNLFVSLNLSADVNVVRLRVARLACRDVFRVILSNYVHLRPRERQHGLRICARQFVYSKGHWNIGDCA
jgi:hypothetical protein